MADRPSFVAALCAGAQNGHSEEGIAMAMTVVITEAAAQYGIRDLWAGSDVSPVTGPFVSVDPSWGTGDPPLGVGVSLTLQSSAGFSIVVGFTLDSFTSATITSLDLQAPGNVPLVTFTGSITVTPDSIGNLGDNIALAGADFLTGNSVANILEGYGGNDTIDGGDGTDTAVFAGAHTLYTITPGGGNATCVGPDGSDTLVSVERLQFDDGNVALDLTGTAGMAYRLYQAAFNRAPDLGGLGYQMHDLDTWLTLTQVAWNFIASPEFQATYGNVDDTQFITLLYHNVLHREPDEGGLQYHLDEMHVLGESRADILVHFSESPENQSNVAPAIDGGIFYWPFTG
jgi:Ca2+-binding RTX toxin-like protein